MAEITKDQSTKGNILVTETKNQSIMADILAILTQDNSSKGDILVVDNVKASSTRANFQLANARIPTSVKNLSIGFPDQPGDVVFKDVDGSTTMSGALVTASGIQLRLSNTISSTTSVPNNYQLALTYTLTPAVSSRRLFGTFHYSVYEDSISTNNKIFGGSNISAYDYKLWAWSDWGLSDNYNLKMRFVLLNISGATHDIIIVVNTRYIVEGASL